MTTFSKPARILFLTLLLLRSRIFTAPKHILSKIRLVSRGQRLTPHELAEVLQQLYIKQSDGSKTLLVPYRDSYLSKVCLLRS